MNAPGWPGIPARWTSSAKSGVGTAHNPLSKVWFTISHGILDEIYYPRVDWACTRDLGVIVTDGYDYFSEEKRHTQSHVSYLATGVPAFHLVNRAGDNRYRIEKEIISDPQRNVVLQRTRFVPLQGALADYRLYVLLAPHLGNYGAGNSGWVGDSKGEPVLYAEREGLAALALLSSVGWRARAVGFVGVSDGWQDLTQHKQLTWFYDHAENGNVALVGEINLAACAGEFVLALGFDEHAFAAAHHARISLLKGFDATCATYIAEWQQWQATLLELDDAPQSVELNDAPQPAASAIDLYRTSTAVLRTHEDKHFRGGLIASLSIPWGDNKGDDDLGGYHLVWTRDMVESVGGLLAAGAKDEVQRVLRYLITTQETDGHWPQNMWLDGTAYWGGVQLDEAAFPILLVGYAQREGLLDATAMHQIWPMVRRAAGFVVRTGPVTQQDRWEEDGGYSPFTLAVAISGLLVAADLAEAEDELAVAQYLREVADNWNSNLERWTYATDTELAHTYGVEGYYVRIGADDDREDLAPTAGWVAIKNRPMDHGSALAAQIVSPDALALVRFGLRAADDLRIRNTLKVLDGELKVELPAGPAWYRYNEDGYGEHEDGSAFDGTGIGRAWPLLTGERAHYAIAAGDLAEAQRLLKTLEGFANASGLLSEQVWDAADIPDRELIHGRPTGSAMPLVWAHAEYVKLRHSLRDGVVFDMPSQTVQRYQVEQVVSPFTVWRFNQKCRMMTAGTTLRIEVPTPATVHWSTDGWQTVQDMATRDTTLGLHIADLATANLVPTTQLVFTFFWTESEHWEGANFTVQVMAAD
ncbi:MAG: glucan 1,4-alpha-glucosidase [Caldilineaceae bacterium]